MYRLERHLTSVHQFDGIHCFTLGFKTYLTEEAFIKRSGKFRVSEFDLANFD